MSFVVFVTLSMAKSLNQKALLAIGEKIRTERIDLNLEIADISDQTGLHYNTIVKMESGHDALLSSFIEVCFALNLHPRTVLEVDLDVKPRFSLSASRREKSRLTSRIKDLFDKGYFISWRGTRDVVQELNKGFDLQADSKNVSSIMKRLVMDQHLKLKKEGRKNFYRNLK